jgi:hypothetical protein
MEERDGERIKKKTFDFFGTKKVFVSKKGILSVINILGLLSL